MIGDNNYLRNKEMAQARLNAEKKSFDRKNFGTNQAQLGRVKFQDIADERYNSSMEQLTGNKFDSEAIMENAEKNKKALDAQRETFFYKKWN